jgi:hypothetical protein
MKTCKNTCTVKLVYLLNIEYLRFDGKHLTFVYQKVNFKCTQIIQCNLKRTFLRMLVIS